MYNGIGLTTPRGSGTNGHVQSNKFFVRPKTDRVTDSTRPFDADQGNAGLTTRKPNKEIIEHDRKRQIELRLVILEDKLAEQGYTESEIAEKLIEARKALEDSQQDNDEEEGEITTGQQKVSDMQTHQVSARKEKQMERHLGQLLGSDLNFRKGERRFKQYLLGLMWKRIERRCSRAFLLHSHFRL